VGGTAASGVDEVEPERVAEQDERRGRHGG
jgi:hypothetical protein